MQWLWDTFIWLVMGGILGWLASIVLKQNDSMGMISNVIAGVIGAWLGNLVQGWLAVGVGNWFWNFLFALIGAVVIVAILGWFRGRRSTA